MQCLIYTWCTMGIRVRSDDTRTTHRMGYAADVHRVWPGVNHIWGQEGDRRSSRTEHSMKKGIWGKESCCVQQTLAGTIATPHFALVQVSANKVLREDTSSHEKWIMIGLDHGGHAMETSVNQWGSFWGRYSAPKNEISKGKSPLPSCGGEDTWSGPGFLGDQLGGKRSIP